MAALQLTLKKEVYRDLDRLNAAIDEIRRVGAFSELDTRYATRLGVLSGTLPDERVAYVEGLACVSTTMLSEVFHKFESADDCHARQ